VSHRMDERGFSATRLQLRMSRAEIGSYLGLSMESVSRAFSALAAGRSIAVDQRSVRLLSVEALRAMAGPVGRALDRRGDTPAALSIRQLRAA
ncbi:MAG: transcriptional regulator, partial [Comamonadaceae bacterium]